MNREEFLRQLEGLLADIPEEEKREALDYYNNYFDDAGPEQESRVMEELGSPAKVAAMIKADLQGGGKDYGEFTERGYEDPRTREVSQVPGQYTKSRLRQRRQGKGPQNATTIILVVLLVIFVSPMVFGIGGAAIGLIAGIFGVLLALVLALPCAMIGVSAAGVGLVAVGIRLCFTSPAVGLAVMGTGFFLIALGMLIFLAIEMLASRLLPWLFHKLTDLWHRLFNRKAAGNGAPKEKQGGV